MNLYKYLLTKLNLKFYKLLNLLQTEKYKNLDPEYNNWNFCENDDGYVGVWYCPEYPESEVYEEVYTHFRQLSTNMCYLFMDQNSYKPFFSDKFVNQYKMLTKTLKLFPEELTSKEEVDLLLTLNGMNIC